MTKMSPMAISKNSVGALTTAGSIIPISSKTKCNQKNIEGLMHTRPYGETDYRENLFVISIYIIFVYT